MQLTYADTFVIIIILITVIIQGKERMHRYMEETEKNYDKITHNMCVQEGKVERAYIQTVALIVGRKIVEEIQDHKHYTKRMIF